MDARTARAGLRPRAVASSRLRTRPRGALSQAAVYEVLATVAQDASLCSVARFRMAVALGKTAMQDVRFYGDVVLPSLPRVPTRLVNKLCALAGDKPVSIHLDARQVNPATFIAGVKRPGRVHAVYWRVHEGLHVYASKLLTVCDLQRFGDTFTGLKAGVVPVRLNQVQCLPETLHTWLAKVDALAPRVSKRVHVLGFPSPHTISWKVEECLQMLRTLVAGPTLGSIDAVHFPCLSFFKLPLTDPRWRTGVELCRAWLLASKMTSLKIATVSPQMMEPPGSSRQGRFIDPAFMLFVRDLRASFPYVTYLQKNTGPETVNFYFFLKRLHAAA